MQDYRTDIYILTWTCKAVGNGPIFQTIPVSYDYDAHKSCFIILKTDWRCTEQRTLLLSVKLVVPRNLQIHC